MEQPDFSTNEEASNSEIVVPAQVQIRRHLLSKRTRIVLSPSSSTSSSQSTHEIKTSDESCKRRRTGLDTELKIESAREISNDGKEVLLRLFEHRAANGWRSSGSGAGLDAFAGELGSPTHV